MYNNLESDFNETAVTIWSDVYIVGEIPWNVRVIGALVGLILMSTCIPGNILLMIVFLMKPLDKGIKQLKTNFAGQLVFSLAVSDTFFLIVRGFLSVHTYMKGTWTFGTAACTLLFATRRVCHTLAVEHIVAISFVRYMAVVHHKIVAPKWYGTALVLIILYTIPIVLVVFFIPDRLVFLPKTIMCLSFETATKKQVNSNIVKVVAVMIVVAVGLVLCYFHIYIHVRRSRATIHSIQNNPEDNDEARMNAIFIHREIKLIRTIAYVFFSFSLTYPVASVLLAIDRDMEWSYGVHYICVASDTLTAGLNWIIYGVTNSWIRKRYRQIMSCQICSERKQKIMVAPVADCIVAAGTSNSRDPVPGKSSLGVHSSSTHSPKLAQVRKQP